MNIENILKSGIGALKESKISNPHLESEILLSSLIKKSKEYITLNPKVILNFKQVNQFKTLIARRRKREPIAYLINKKEFWNDEFYINKNVLIPRPDTELIIEETLKLYSKKTQLNFLDIGTGSGCIIYQY